MSNTIDKIRVNGTDYDVGGSGGGGVQVVNFTLNGDGTAIADFTLAEVLAAHKNGSVVIGESSSNGVKCVFQLTACSDEVAMFIGFENCGDSLGVYTIVVTPEGCVVLNNHILFQPQQ